MIRQLTSFRAWLLLLSQCLHLIYDISADTKKNSHWCFFFVKRRICVYHLKWMQQWCMQIHQVAWGWSTSCAAQSCPQYKRQVCSLEFPRVRWRTTRGTGFRANFQCWVKVRNTQCYSQTNWRRHWWRVTSGQVS